MPDDTNTNTHATTQTRPLTDAALPVAAPMPQRVGRYVLEARIDVGGMGVVYRARHIETRRLVALKLLRSDLASEAGIARFRRESQLLGKLQHESIAQVFDAGTDHDGSVDIPYIAMEFVPDALNIVRFARKHELSVRERVRLFARVCRGVHHAHEQSIIHRDLKPSNILVDVEGNPKIIDFGIAKSFDPQNTVDFAHTESGQVLGTIRYMSPEQTRDSANIDFHSDIYSLGVVLYELVCGRMPYKLDGVTPIQAIRIIQEESPTQPSTSSGSIDKDLETILVRLLAKERSRRYPSALKVAEDLEAYLAGRPVWARADSVLYVWKKELSLARKRHTLATAVAVSILAMVLTFFSGPTLLYSATNLASHYAGWVMSFAAPPERTSEHVAVIGVRDPARLTEIARERNLPEIDPSKFYTIRPLLAALTDRLVQAEARSITFDLIFQSCQPTDGLLIDAMKRARERGIEVVVGRERFRPSAFGPGFCPDIAAVSSSGAILVSHDEESGWVVRLGLLSKQDEETYSSLGIAAYAATRKPGFDYEASLADAAVRINYRARDQFGSRQRADSFDVLSASEVGNVEQTDITLGLDKKDLMASSRVMLTRQAIEQTEPFTTLLEDALLMSDAELQERMRGKAVVVIDLRPGEDQHTDASGQTIHKGYVWACWLDQALTEYAIRSPSRAWSFAQVFAGSALGAALLPLGVSRRRIVSLGVVGIGCAALAATGFIVMATSSTLFIPLYGMLALCVAGSLSAIFPTNTIE